MSMRLYKVSGQWYTWDYLHNELGYTESASTTTAYKSSDSDTWGQSVVDSGYRFADDSSDLETYEFWIENVSGWFSASEMAQEGYYPSFATDGPRFVKEGELSVSVEISGNSWSGTWYLLKKDVAIGWCTERELEENGWEPDQGEIVGGLISDTYDKRIYSFGNGGLLVPGAYAYSDGDLLDMQWNFGGLVEEYSPVPAFIEVDLGLKYDSGSWQSKRLNDWWYGGFLNQNDVDVANQFGLPPQPSSRVSSLGNLAFNPDYCYRIIAIFSNIVDGHGSGSIAIDLSYFYIANSNKYPNYQLANQVFFDYINSSTTYAMAYRVRISKYNPPLQRHTAYLAQSKEPVWIQNLSYVLYDENGNAILADSGKRYDMIAYYYSSSDSEHPYTEVDPTGGVGLLYISWTNGSNVKLNRYNGYNTLNIQRIEYVIADIN